jgi:hypothetical protein
MTGEYIQKLEEENRKLRAVYNAAHAVYMNGGSHLVDRDEVARWMNLASALASVSAFDRATRSSAEAS